MVHGCDKSPQPSPSSRHTWCSRSLFLTTAQIAGEATHCSLKRPRDTALTQRELSLSVQHNQPHLELLCFQTCCEKLVHYLTSSENDSLLLCGSMSAELRTCCSAMERWWLPHGLSVCCIVCMSNNPLPLDRALSIARLWTVHVRMEICSCADFIPLRFEYYVNRFVTNDDNRAVTKQRRLISIYVSLCSSNKTPQKVSF